MQMYKKILALLMALAVVFSLAACGGVTGTNEPEAKDPAEDLYGEWQFEFDLIDMMNEVLSAENDGFEVDSKLPVLVTFEFSENGKFEGNMVMDEDDLDNFKKDLVDALEDLLYEMAEAEGVSKSEFDDAFEAENNMTVKEYCEAGAEEMCGEMDDMEDDFGEFCFKYDGEKIYLAEDEDDLDDAECTMKVTLKGDALTIKDVDGDIGDFFEKMEEIEIDFPMEFEKQ